MTREEREEIMFLSKQINLLMKQVVRISKQKSCACVLNDSSFSIYNAQGKNHFSYEVLKNKKEKWRNE